MYPHFLWLFKEYLTELKDQLKFHDHLLNHVEEWKKSIRKSNSKSIKFIGVHCRRTDYANHYKVVSGATLVDHHFFDTAFDIYRRKYNGDNVKVIFLAVSDDNDWIKVNDYSMVATSTCSMQLSKSSISLSNVALNSNPGTVLETARPEDSKTPPTC